MSLIKKLIYLRTYKLIYSSIVPCSVLRVVELIHLTPLRINYTIIVCYPHNPQLMNTSFNLPPLPYAYDALEPYLDAKTLEIHHSKHHQAYRDNFVKVLEKYPALLEKTPEDILRELNNLRVDEADRIKIKNHGGGFVNHNLFWAVMNPDNLVDEDLKKEITKTFGSVDQFKQQFNQIAIGHFGSGWVWLVRDEDSRLEICSLLNQDSPLSFGHTPILTLDLWEHAYYLKYQNRRAEYVENWWRVVKII